MDEARFDKVCGIKRGTPEPVFVGVVVLGHPVADRIRCSPNADKDFLVVHGDVLHGQDLLSPETAHNEVNLVPGHKPLHGIGGIGHT